MVIAAVSSRWGDRSVRPEVLRCLEAWVPSLNVKALSQALAESISQATRDDSRSGGGQVGEPFGFREMTLEVVARVPSTCWTGVLKTLSLKKDLIEVLVKGLSAKTACGRECAFRALTALEATALLKDLERAVELLTPAKRPPVEAALKRLKQGKGSDSASEARAPASSSVSPGGSVINVKVKVAPGKAGKRKLEEQVVTLYLLGHQGKTSSRNSLNGCEDEVRVNILVSPEGLLDASEEQVEELEEEMVRSGGGCEGKAPLFRWPPLHLSASSLRSWRKW